MKKSQVEKEYLWANQGERLRNPLDIYGATQENAGWNTKSLRFKQTDSFNKILKKLNITLLVSREYEHLLCSYSPTDTGLSQGFLSIPHPSGIAVDKENNRVYVASTRNPNAILEFGISNESMSRIEDANQEFNQKALMPLRSKFYPGAYYFHDLAIIDGQLYANSVGQNGVVKIDMDSSNTDDLFWQIDLGPDHTDKLQKGNYIQLNSIAAGNDFESSFFSASTDQPGRIRPGQKNFKVNATGVIFDSKSQVIARGLTRPHSARLYRDELWVNNSGYGQLGKIVARQFEVQFELPGWTRGLHFVGDYAFVGYSQVLKKFRQFAPGIDPKNATCGIAAINLKTNEIEAQIEFPFGNQIFQIDAINADICDGFLYRTQKTEAKKYISQHYKYKTTQ
jgi:uncharacterized protein (TIGR03032 family)